MTQKDKELLLKDLSARIPYGVKVELHENVYTLLGYLDDFVILTANVPTGQQTNISNIKPYLRPMSSMTEEEKEDFELIREWSGELNGIGGYYVEVDDASKYIDFLNSHQFDYRGLIEKGLALEALEGIYTLNK